MSASFPVENGELIVGGMPLAKLAARVGRTPFYVYDRRLLDARMRELRQALPDAVEIHYAVKANPMPALVGYMACLADGLDVASGGELAVALDAGANPQCISFAGPAKSVGELAQAVAAGILINVESLREIRVLSELSQRGHAKPRVAVRVNPDFELKMSGMKMGGGPKQFGIDAEQVPGALAQIGAAELAFEGFHVFSGSQNLQAAAICESQARSLDLVARLAKHAPRPVRSVNLGGGFGIPYFQGDKPLDLAPIGENLASLVE
jgi:diaminopimelate decarboxylase